ncbi:MAG: hypothetical protein ACI89U_001651 [Gammaproteobacteria bacterium]|jgi:hypothetical protein
MSPLLENVIWKLETWFRFRCYVILRQSLNSTKYDVKELAHVSIREASNLDLEKAVLNPELDISSEFVKSALATKDRCFAAFSNDAMVAYTWRTKRSAPHEDVGVSVEPPYCYGYKGLTLPDFRGLRLNAHVNHAANGIYLAEGFTHFLTFASVYNTSSLRAMKKSAGYERIGYMVYGKWFGKFWLLRSRKVKLTGMRFG